MAKKYQFLEQNYELIKDEKNGFDFEVVSAKFTDYFLPYDYVCGDWSYGKLRLKGFCDKTNKIYNERNNYQNLDKYIKEECAYGCKYFVIKKVG